MKWMTRAFAVVLVTSLAGWGVSSAAVGDDEATQKIDDATSVLQQFVNIPENAIPGALLRQAYGIAVIPSVFKISFLGGVQRGKGVLAVRTRDGQWSDPSFITLTGGSVGFQAGVSSTDIILVFKTQRSVDRIANGQISLGGDASVAAGPVGRSVGASTNMDFNAEVYSYSRSRGLFGGVSLGGARIGIDKDANWLFYNQPGIEASTVLSRGSDQQLPEAGRQFVYTLNQYMPASNDQFHYNAQTGQQTNQQAEQNADQNASADQSGTSGAGAASSSGQTQPYHNGGQYQSQGQSSGITVQQGAGNGTGANNANGTSDYTGDSSNYSGVYQNSNPQGAGGG